MPARAAATPSAGATHLRRLRLLAAPGSRPSTAVWPSIAFIARCARSGRRLESRRLSAEEQGSLLVLVESVEQGAGQLEEHIVVSHHGEPPDEHVHPWGLGRVVTLVGEIG